MTLSYRKVFLDRDFVEDKDGYLYCVVGYVHPPDRVLAYLKYVPTRSLDTIWFKGKVGYDRVLKYYSSVAVTESFKILKKVKPHYIYYDNVFNITFIGVPISEIRKHYIPEERLKEIIESGGNDELEQDLIELVKCLSEITNVKIQSFGISGSILTSIHHPRYSDIDLTVYGIANSWTLIKVLREADGKDKIKLPEDNVIKEWALEVSKHHPLTPKEAYLIYVEKKMRLVFKESRVFSIHPILLPEEVDEKYGDKIYVPKDLIKIKGKVVDNRLSIFLPGKYIVDDVSVLEGKREYSEIEEVVTFEGLYSGILDVDEEFIAYGKVEEVHDRIKGRKYLRLVIGSAEAKGKDYIKPLRWLR